MAIKKFKKSSILTDVRYDSMLAGYPGVMATPTATDGGTGTTASVAFTTVSGSTGYTALSSPGSLTGTGTSSPITVSGLTEGTAYTFQVRAENADGNGAYSAASNSITPVVPPAFESIQTITLTSSQADIEFTSIPSDYKHLQLRFSALSATAGWMTGYLNGDTGNNYTYHDLRGNGASVTLGKGISLPNMYMLLNAANTTTMPMVGVIDILDYKNTNKYKTVRSLGGQDANGSGYIQLSSNLWMSTSAITSIKLVRDTWQSGSIFALYGVK